LSTLSVPVSTSRSKLRPRTALVASADSSFRRHLSEKLVGLRWQVREVEGGAAAWSEVESAAPEAVIVDSWLPDIDHDEFLATFRSTFPSVELFVAGGAPFQHGLHCPHRQELLYALRHAEDSNKIFAESGLPDVMDAASDGAFSLRLPLDTLATSPSSANSESPLPPKALVPDLNQETAMRSERERERCRVLTLNDPLPELVGNENCMLEVSRRIRLVARRTTSVLIEGPTGSGKELVAEALHRLSTRSRKPFVAINCAAIPEALLEAELFGHTRGAFTGAVQGRVGRIEAADGGTLFLDEIGEMPLALQAKLLRFVESGELQRVGDNETVRVDIRILAATHRPLAQHTQTGEFRADLYYRLAVFLIRTPALSEHIEDLPLLVDHFLEKMGRRSPVKQINAAALQKLMAHGWPGNVRELEHVLERAAILAGDSPTVTAAEIDFGMMVN
jgi:DNA-binding NtrC family response regulator